MTPTLWHIELSHYSEKARWALDYKEVPHRRRTAPPGLHGPLAMGITRSGHRRMPVARLDGRVVPDSTDIIAVLEELHPDPPLYPSDPAERARALELEDWFDENLGPAMRRYNWFHTIDDTDATAASLFTNGGAMATLMKPGLPLARPFVKRDYGVDAEGAEAARLTMLEAAELIERESAATGYLVGDSFTVADLTGAALFTPMIDAPGRQYAPPAEAAAPGVLEMRSELEGRPGGQWVQEMFARHRGRSAELAR